MTTNNEELIKIAKELNISLKDVCMKNMLPNKRTIGNYIINLASYPNNGTHWVLLIVNNNISFYFDSFGELPPTEIYEFCKTEKKKLCYNTFEIQDLKSNLCGFYCISLIKFVHDKMGSFKTKKSFLDCCNNFINMFKKNTKLNGKVLKEYLSKFDFSLKKYFLENN
jgi:hypothetical protein